MSTPPQHQPNSPQQQPGPWQHQQQGQPWQPDQAGQHWQQPQQAGQHWQQQQPQQSGQAWQQQQSGQAWQQQQSAQHWQQQQQQQSRQVPVGAPGSARPNPIGAILLLLGAAICVASTVLPWLDGVDWVETSTGIEGRHKTWNGWSWAAAGQHSGNALGMLLYLALALGVVGSVMVVVAAFRHFAGHLSMGLAWTGTALGLVGTLGTIGTIVMLQLSEGKEGLDIFKIGCWLFAASFLVVLAGTLLSRPSARTRGR